MEVGIISPTEEAILRALGQFHYCHSKHLIRLGVAKHPGPVQAALKTLRERSPLLVRALDFGVLPGVGRLPILYGLTERGADTLLDLGVPEEHTQWVKTPNLFTNDYQHRCQCVDLHISIAQWLDTVDGALNTFLTYYSKGRLEGGTTRQATALTIGEHRLAPDLVATFTMPDGNTRLCVVEQHNGDDAKRLLRQVQVYASLRVLQAIEDAHNYPHGLRLLLVFEKEKTLEKFRKLAAKDSNITARANRLFLKTHEEAVAGFYSGWRGIEGEERRALF